MKKPIIIFLATMLMISSVSLAEDPSSLPDADLLVLYRQVSIELESRGIDPKAVYPEDAFPGDDLWNKDMADRLALFFGFWNASDIPSMLTVCSPGWKDGIENPDTNLLTILGNRTATGFDINAVSKGPSDYIRIVSLTVGIDKSNGKDLANYILQISMTREADGLWYVDPGSLQTFEYPADDSYAASASEAAEETAENTVLYYCPEGGQYYHADQNCKTVNEKYLPLQGAFTYGELENEAYKDLQPCNICGAPLRRENPVDEPVSVDKDTFTVPNIITAKGIEDFIGEWHYFRIVNEDGSEMNREEMLAEGLANERAEVIITEDDII